MCNLWSNRNVRGDSNNHTLLGSASFNASQKGGCTCTMGLYITTTIDATIILLPAVHKNMQSGDKNNVAIWLSRGTWVLYYVVYL